MLLYSGFSSVFFITPIQIFWLVACADADRIAISPLPPMASDAIWICFNPIRSALEGLSCIRRPSGARPLSKEITLIPRAMAFFVIGTSAFGSLAEMTMASTF